tara:strand:+ start:2628 stop:3044 length:417 start_codon:yes stop_codon:yes gene_type:complete
MSINQLISQGKVGTGLNLDVGNVKQKGYLPTMTASTHNISTADLEESKLIVFSTNTADVTCVFPSNASLGLLLPNAGDFMHITVKYRTSGSITISGIDTLFFIVSNTSYTLEPSNAIAYKTQVIGVARTNAGGTLRMY